ncbi:MAG: DUF998 domain-containing protein [Pseudomonadota bacterium]
MTQKHILTDTLVGQLSYPADALLLRICAALALLGTVLLIGSNVVGSLLVERHDWVADTVSDLAAGRLEYIQDIGLYGYAAGLLALSLALSHVRMPSHRWTIAALGLGVVALLVTIIGARNEYGDGDSEGVEIHIYLVYALGVAFTVVFFAAAPGLTRLRAGLGTLSYGCGVLWTIGAPIFFLLPTAYDGLWERGLGLITCVWVVAVGWAVWRLARPAKDATIVREVVGPVRLREVPLR